MFQVGDIVRWKSGEKYYDELTNGPMVVSRSWIHDGPNEKGEALVEVRTLDNLPVEETASGGDFGFYAYRFELDPFLDAARKAIHAQKA